MAKETAAAAKEKVEKDHAKSGRPVGPVDDPTVHAIGGNKDAEDAKDKEKLDEDNSLGGRLRKSELYMVNDHSTGRRYVGISPQNDPNATEASKRLSTVQALDGAAPETGLQVQPKEGDAFVIGDGFGPDATPADWAKVTKPDGSPFF